MGLEAWVCRVLVGEPAVLGRLARARPRDPRGVPGAAASKRRGRLRPPVPGDCHGGEPRRPARRGDPAGARPRGRRRRQDAARARTAARGGPRERTVAELALVGHTPPLEAPAETAGAIAHVPRAARRRPGRRRRGSCAPTRRPRNAPEGPFGHLDVRWVVGPETGATQISFGQSTYPKARRTRTTTTRTPRRS